MRSLCLLAVGLFAAVSTTALTTTARSSIPPPPDRSKNGPIKFITVGGTYYSVGYQVGQQVKDILLSRLKLPDYEGFQYLLGNSSGARMMNDTLYSTTNRAYPELIEELQGIADGASIPFPTIWMMNIVDELSEYQRFIYSNNEHPDHEDLFIKKQFPRLVPGYPPFPLTTGKMKDPKIPASVLHCTDVFTNEVPTLPAWGHNEDSGLYDVNHTYMVRARIYNNNSQNNILLEEFQAYTYAGSIAGKAYQWNHHGLLFSCNALFAMNDDFADPDSLPRAIHNRVVLRSRTVDEAIRYSQAMPSTTSYSLNVVYSRANISLQREIPFKFARYRNIEIWPMGKHSVREIYPPNKPSKFNWSPKVSRMKHYFFHANDYQVLNVSYIVDPSSVDRLARLNEMPVPQNITDVRTMLGDTKNKVHPVYRYGTGGCYTMSTAIFNFEDHMIDIYTANPKNHTKVMSFPMDMNKV